MQQSQAGQSLTVKCQSCRGCLVHLSALAICPTRPARWLYTLAHKSAGCWVIVSYVYMFCGPLPHAVCMKVLTCVGAHRSGACELAACTPQVSSVLLAACTDETHDCHSHAMGGRCALTGHLSSSNTALVRSRLGVDTSAYLLTPSARLFRHWQQ